MNPTSTSTSTSSSSDEPFFLDWGSSVNVNNDLRRAIQSEIETIHGDIQSLQSSIQTEQKTTSHLSRDFSHAQAELIHLSRGAGDDRDNATMNEEILRRLKNSTVKEVIGVIEGSTSSGSKHTRSGDDDDDDDSTEKEPVTVTVTPPRTTRGDGDIHMDVDVDVDGFDRNGRNSNFETNANTNTNRPPPQADNSGDVAMVQDVVRRTREIQKLRTIIQNQQTNLHKSTSQLTQVNYDLKVAHHGVDRQHKNQSAWNDDVDGKKREWDMEKSRIKSAKDKLFRSRELTGEYTQQHTNDLKQLGSVKERHHHNEMQWTNEYSTVEKEVQSAKDQLSSLTSSISDTTHKIQRLQQQFQQRDEILQERKMIQSERTKIQDEMKNVLSIREKEWMEKIARMEQDIRTSRDACDALQRQKLELDHEAQKGQREDVEIIQPAQVKLTQLSERGEELSRDIANLQEKSRTEKQAFDTEVASHRTTLNDLMGQVSQKDDYLKGQQETLERMQKEREELTQAFTNEMDQHQNLKIKFDEANRAQAEVVKALMEQREREKMERKEAREREVLVESVKLETLTRGVEIIEATKRLEKDLEQKIEKIQKQIDG